MKEGTKELFTELVRREELLFSMVSNIRLDLNSMLSEVRTLDEILTRIMRVEEKDFEAQIEDAR